MSNPITKGLATGTKVAALGLLLAFAIPNSAMASSSCAYANTPVAATTKANIRASVVCLINHQRTSRGLPALHTSRRLNRSAQHWTDTMVSRDEFTHGTNFAGRISAVGYNWATAGENIAVGFTTPFSVVRAWMASTGHCQNILYPEFAQVGTGVLDQGISGWGGASTWTQDFGLWMGHTPPSHRMGPADGCPYRI